MGSDRLNAFLGILNFFIPAEVLSAVLLVFTMENIFDYTFSTYIPSEFQGLGWVIVYFIGVVSISALNYATADADELADLSDDLDDF
jgi:hypothetical protein